MRVFDGIHRHAAEGCFRAGFPENAASWMNQDIEELSSDPSDLVMPLSIVERDGRLWYRTVGEAVSCVDGDGI